MSEPIQIFIKTIQIIIKLKKLEKNKKNLIKPTSSLSSLKKENPENYEYKNDTITADDPVNIDSNNNGKITTVITKSIINNIRYNIDNIIIKFYQKKIGLSINIMNLNMNVANNKWEITTKNEPFSLESRKLIIITGLTVCLDQINDKNEIEIYDEPIIKKCSFEIRQITKLINNNLNITGATAASVERVTIKNSNLQHRIDILTHELISNISSLHINLLTNLFDIINYIDIYNNIAKNGGTNKKDTLSNNGSEISIASSASTIEEIEQSSIISPTIAEDISDQHNHRHSSYIPWALNWLSSFFVSNQITRTDMTTKTRNDDNDNTNNSNDEDEEYYKMENIINIGIYLDEFHLILKLSEIFNTNKLRYNPLLEIILKNIFCEIILLDKKWNNIKAGLSSIAIQPLHNELINNFRKKSVVTIRIDNNDDNNANSNDRFENSNWLNDSLFHIIKNNAGEILVNKKTIRFPSIDLHNHLKK